MKTTFIRPQAAELARRVGEPRWFIHFVSGARQVGKTTLVRQVAERGKLPFHFASADDPAIDAGKMWIRLQWAQARRLAGASGHKGALLILDEIQKIPRWTTTVKSLWDADTRYRRPVKVVLIGSAPLLAARGSVESLDEHLENLHLPHWSFAEMRRAFGWNLKQYLFYGAYPGAAHLIHEPARWARHIKEALMETTVVRDVLPLARVGKPLLLRRVSPPPANASCITGATTPARWILCCTKTAGSPPLKFAAAKSAPPFPVWGIFPRYSAPQEV